MEISPERLEEFKAIYKKEYGVDLGDDEAYNIALPILQLMKVICRPLPKGHSCPACREQKEKENENK